MTDWILTNFKECAFWFLCWQLLALTFETIFKKIASMVFKQNDTDI